VRRNFLPVSCPEYNSVMLQSEGSTSQDSSALFPLSISFSSPYKTAMKAQRRVEVQLYSFFNVSFRWG
jgi:hypothetical protein